MRAHSRLWSAWALAALLAACGSTRGNTGLSDASANDLGPPGDATSCEDPLTLCNGYCVDLLEDPLNCGACGTQCGGTRVCTAAVCVAGCQADQRLCAGRCANINTDRSNCGACDRVCPTGQVCAMGACGVECGPSLMRCDPPDGGVSAARFCTDPRTDERNCGGCGNACPRGQSCVDGACTLQCAGGLAACDGRCVDVMTDSAHCGGCGSACPDGQRCAAGVCSGDVCASGFTACGGRCVDARNDVRNCGRCDNVCPLPGQCSAGTCRLDCPIGRLACSNRCADVMTDPDHCGRCENACPSGQTCQAGTCRLVCPTGTMLCTDRCADVTTDRLNCGSCGNTCGPGQFCTGGACTVVCASTQTICGGRCVDLANDRTHCGGCDSVCPDGYGCIEGGCRARDGVDAGNCAAPSAMCGGRCVDPRSDNRNCGMCARSCAGDRVCVAGNCVAPCAAGQARCGTACTVVATDRMNCGACGTVCPGMQACIGGRCVDAPPTRYAPMSAPGDVAFVDACAATGAATYLPTVDDGSAIVRLPFAFRYWATDLAANAPVNITSNGWLGMDGVASNALSGTIPLASAPNAVVALHWADLYDNLPVCVATVGSAPSRKWVVEWSGSRYLGGSIVSVFEAIFSEGTNTIDFVYQTTTDTQVATAGLENQTGTAAVSGCADRTSYSCPIPSNTRTRFQPIP